MDPLTMGKPKPTHLVSYLIARPPLLGLRPTPLQLVNIKVIKTSKQPSSVHAEWLRDHFI